MSVSDAKRLKQLEGENAKLKKLLAEAMLDNAVLQDITSTWTCIVRPVCTASTLEGSIILVLERIAAFYGPGDPLQCAGWPDA
jgi:hypothetical protein